MAWAGFSAAPGRGRVSAGRTVTPGNVAVRAKLAQYRLRAELDQVRDAHPLQGLEPGREPHRLARMGPPVGAVVTGHDFAREIADHRDHCLGMRRGLGRRLQPVEHRLEQVRVERVRQRQLQRQRRHGRVRQQTLDRRRRARHRQTRRGVVGGDLDPGMPRQDGAASALRCPAGRPWRRQPATPASACRGRRSGGRRLPG